MRRLNVNAIGLLIMSALVLVAALSRANASTLESVTWQLASVAQPDKSLRPVAATVEATAAFAHGALSGSGGCNRYRASYRLDNDQLSITQVALTMMACPEPQAATEQAFVAALEATARYRIADQQLTLLNAAGQVLAVLKAQPPTALHDTLWRATVYNDGRGAAVSLLDGTSITATFTADGVMSGSAGCNTYRATYSTTQPKITIQTPSTTRKMCNTPAQIMEQESAYLKALTSAATYTLNGQQLELRTADQALVALFQRAAN